MIKKAKTTIQQRVELAIREEINKEDFKGVDDFIICIERFISQLTERTTEIIQDEINYGRF